MDTSEQYRRLPDEVSPLESDYKIEQVRWYKDPVYIKMCEKAEEIQTDSPWNHDDEHNYFHEFETLPKNDIWLPRQDQLQAMVAPKVDDIPRLMCWMIRDFALFCQDKEITTMEQLWLAFVMKVKYNKVWDATDWVERD